MRKVERPPALFGQRFEYGKMLDELAGIGKFDEFFEVNDQKYPYWDRWKWLAKDWNYDAKKLWWTVRQLRSVGENRVDFSGLKGGVLHFNTPSVIQEQLHELDLNLGGSLHTGDLIPSEEKQRYLISSLMEEAIASSQIEGAATTRKLAKEMLESNRKPRNESEQMIYNNYSAMLWIVENKNVRLTPEIILQLHQIITYNTMHASQEEAAFRRSDDVRVIDTQTGFVLHTPPSHDQLATLMVEFCSFANDSRKERFFLHPIAKAIMLHFLIGYIHPFSDGNGRTARALFYWYLIKKGYWLIEYMSVSRVILDSKAQYARAYQHTELDQNNCTYFILYNLKCIGKALEELKTYIARKNREKKNVLELLRHTDYNDRQILLLQDILADQKNVFTVQEVQTKFGVSNQTARTDLNQLVEKGILQSRKSGKKIQFVSVQGVEKKLVEG